MLEELPDPASSGLIVEIEPGLCRVFLRGVGECRVFELDEKAVRRMSPVPGSGEVLDFIAGSGEIEKGYLLLGDPLSGKSKGLIHVYRLQDKE
jgi:hypothetical protein